MRATPLLSEHLIAAAGSDSPLGYRRAFWTLIVLFAVAGTVVAVQGAAPITGPWDVMAALDEGWRILRGQAPHVDFHNPIGPLSYELIALGMSIGTPSTSSIPYGSALLLAVALPCAWWLASVRLPWPMAFVTVLLCGVLLLAPRPLGFGVRETTYAMIYNREGYVLFMLLAIAALLEPRRTRWSSPAAEGFVIGVLLALALYCKITYFVAGALTLAASAAVRRHSRRSALAGVAGLGAVCLLFWVVLRVRPDAYLADVLSAGRSQSLRMRGALVARALVENALPAYVLLLCLALREWTSGPGRRDWRGRVRRWLPALCVIAMAALITSGNAAQRNGSDDPLIPLAGLLCVEGFRRDLPLPGDPAGAPARFAYSFALLLFFPACWTGLLAKDVASLTYASAWNLEHRGAGPRSGRIDAGPLRDFVVPDSTSHVTAYWSARDHPERIGDGIQLLRDHLQRGDRVATLALANPFSFALGLRPALGEQVWWELDITFDERHHPPAEAVLGDATLVMIPRLGDRRVGIGFETADALCAIYCGYVTSHFDEAARSGSWMLFRRRATP